MGGLPVLTTSLDSLVQKLQGAYGATTQGQFTNAMQLFNQILQAVPFLVVDGKKELNDVCGQVCCTVSRISSRCAALACIKVASRWCLL